MATALRSGNVEKLNREVTEAVDNRLPLEINDAIRTRMLSPLSGWLDDAFHACDHHHERWDGKGYPYGLSGDAISLSGRIVSVADAFAVMTMARSYKKPYSIDVARRELLKGAGSQFDPTVVRAMLAVSVGRMNLIAGPMAAAVNLPLIGPLLGPMVAPVVTFAPSVPSFVRVGAVALMTTSAGVTPMETRPVPWQSEVASSSGSNTSGGPLGISEGNAFPSGASDLSLATATTTTFI